MFYCHLMSINKYTVKKVIFKALPKQRNDLELNFSFFTACSNLGRPRQVVWGNSHNILQAVSFDRIPTPKKTICKIMKATMNII